MFRATGMIARRRYTQTIRTKEWKLHRRYKFEVGEGSSQVGSTAWEWASQCTHQITLELYDMNSDPLEQTNLADNSRCAAIQSELLANLDRWWQGAAATADAQAPCEVEMDPEVIQRLRDLGYLE